MPPYRRTQILIDRRFQLRFALYVVSWICALSLFYPMLFQTLFDNFMRYLSLDPMGPPVQELKARRSELIVLLVAMQVLFAGITFLISIFVSHRIAGPLYKLKKSFREANAAGFPSVRFRKSDHFHDLADAYNQMAEQVRSRAAATGEARELIQKALSETNSSSRSSLEKAAELLR
jgi:methyl-accepting chemotaxis protein